MSFSPISRRAAFGSFAALAATLATGQAARAQSSVSGTYMVEGRNPDGSAYSGRVRITESGGRVTMAWTVGDQSYSGVGVRDGRIVMVDLGDTSPVVYVIMQGGALHGTWADGRALERLTP